jgi:hypothetical protein
MPKRTGNSSVNSSIRQNTASTNEGFGALLAAQEASLGQLSSIRKLMELSKDTEKNRQMTSGGDSVFQERILQTLEDQLKVNKRHMKDDEERFLIDQAGWDSEAKKLSELSKTMNTTGNMFQEMGKSFKDKLQGFKEKTSIKEGGLKRSVLGAINVGGIFNKSIAKSEWMSQQRAMGYNPSKADAEGAYNANKGMKAHEEKIAKWQKKTGITDEAEMRRTPIGNELLNDRITKGEEIAKYDKGAHRFDPTVKGEVNPNYKTPTATAAEATQNEEAQLEGMKAQEANNDLLAKIEENTRPDGKGAEKVKPEEKKGGMFDGLLDFITNMLGDGLMKALKSFFNPKTILKSLGKVFAIGMIVGALFEGIMDGFNEYMETGDIGKALIAGLAGIVDFLTFGLFDKDAIKEVIGDMAGWINEHVVQPYVDFMVAMKDSFLSLVQSIGIPEIKFKIPVIGKEVAIGPFYPFKSEGGSKSPEAPAPTSASTVDQKSADNAAAAVPEKQAGGTTVVNAPTNNSTTQNQHIRAPIRNQDSSATRYVDSRLRQA